MLSEDRATFCILLLIGQWVSAAVNPSQAAFGKVFSGQFGSEFCSLEWLSVLFPTRFVATSWQQSCRTVV